MALTKVGRFQNLGIAKKAEVRHMPNPFDGFVFFTICRKYRNILNQKCEKVRCHREIGQPDSSSRRGRRKGLNPILAGFFELNTGRKLNSDGIFKPNTGKVRILDLSYWRAPTSRVSRFMVTCLHIISHKCLLKLTALSPRLWTPQ